MKRAFLCLGIVAFAVGCHDDRVGGPPDLSHGTSDLSGFVHNEVDLAGFDFPPSLGIVYAHTGQTLYVIDPMTFDVTSVGDFGQPMDDMTDLAVTPDGNIYTISRTSLYSVDKNTAVATMVATGIASSNVALTFNNDGTLLASDQTGAVRVIDPSNGNVTEIGSYGSGYDTAGDLVAIADGTMYGVSTKAPSLGSTSNVLIKVNTSNGVATTVGQIGYTGVFGVAYTGGKVIAFTSTGQIIRIDPMTGAGTLVKTMSGTKWYGAGTSPLVPVL